MLFTLKGRTGPVFRTVTLYRAAGFIPAVYGQSLDGKWQTSARMEDIDIVPDVVLT